MKYFSFIFFLIPALLFLLLVLINKELLNFTQTINFFWIYDFTIPVITYFTIFFGLYVIITWFLLKFSSFFSGLKIKKDESEINTLKARLLDGQGEVIEEIKQNFSDNIEEYKKINTENINSLKKENEKVVTNLEYEITNIKETLKKISK